MVFAETPHLMLQYNHMVDHKSGSKRFLCAFCVVLLAILALAPAFAPDNTYAETCHTQGGSITEDYFIYTWWCGDESDTKIYRCDRSGTKFTGCKVIEHGKNGKYKHANAIQYQWGSKHFWLFGPKSGNPRKSSLKWCFDLSGNKVSNSKCGSIPNNNHKNSDVGKSDRKQGYALYEGYFIKGGSNNNRIFIRKNEKLIKAIEVGHNSEELEDVSVDGNTGEIYYTTSSPQTHLYKVSDYELPVSKNSSSTGKNNSNSSSKNGNGSSSKNGSSSSSSSNSSGNSSSSSGSYHAPQHTESTYDGGVETTFFGSFTDDGKGCGVYSVLGLVVDILTFGIGIAAAIGIVISGITILTAGPDAAKTAKAKRRLFEIIIGLAVYAVLYAALNFLLPGGKFSTDQECSETTTSHIHNHTA